MKTLEELKKEYEDAEDTHNALDTAWEAAARDALNAAYAYAAHTTARDDAWKAENDAYEILEAAKNAYHKKLKETTNATDS